MSLLPLRGLSMSSSYVCIMKTKISLSNLHDQTINVPSAGAQAFLIDTQGEQAMTHHAGSLRTGGFRATQNINYLVTHPITGLCVA
jgi:hypothetical protein